MNTQEKLNKILNYFLSFEVVKDTLIVKTLLEKGWKAFADETKGIKTASSDEEENVWFYYGSKDNVTFDDMIDTIINTVELNNNIKKKGELFRAKAQELKELFSEHDYEELVNLTFNLGKTPKRKKKVTTIPSAIIETIEKKVEEEIVEETTDENKEEKE